jgi:hypothetical protein
MWDIPLTNFEYLFRVAKTGNLMANINDQSFRLIPYQWFFRIALTFQKQNFICLP